MSSFFLRIGFWWPVIWLIFIGYLLTNKPKTAIFDDFRLFWALFGHLFLSSAKWVHIINSSFQELRSIQIFSVKDYSGPFLLRGSLRISFYLNSVAKFLHCTFRLQQFFIILLSSDFAHIPNLCFPLMKLTMDKVVCPYIFHLREIGMQTLGTFKKKALFLGSESVNMLIGGMVAAMRVVKNHSKMTPFVFFLCLQQFVFTPFPLLCTSKVATELRIHNFTVFRTVIIFVLIFRPFLILRMRWKSLNLFSLKCCFYWWKPFPQSIIVFEKYYVKFGVRFIPNFELIAAVAVYPPRASYFALMSLIFMIISYILSSTFQFKLY